MAARLKRKVLQGRTTILFAIIDDLCNHIPYRFQKGVDYTLSLHWNVEFLRPTPVSFIIKRFKKIFYPTKSLKEALDYLKAPVVEGEPYLIPL